ncbi:MAG TPA: hypothetical protein H9832_00975 [Candidatus Agathobaculum merdavium]|nr:hypothetical protein [Candidatus Agathobaculum merdavium]
MSKKQQIPNTQLSGRNIYTDKKKRVIYYDWLTKQGYLVEKKFEGPVLFYQNRVVIILFIAILCAGTFLTWQQATLAGIALLAVVEIYYRRKLFRSLEVVTDVDFGRRLTPLQSIVERKNKEKVIALIVLWAAFAILFPLNAYMEQYSLPLMIFSVGLSIVGIYFCVLHIIALTRMK